MSKISTKKITLTGTQKPFLERYESLTKLYTEVRQYQPLSFEETKEYFDQYQNGTEKEKQNALEMICRHNMKLVISMARKYCSTQDNLMDLIQEGSIGLLAAVDKYNINLGTSFQAHAMYHIRRYINLFKTNTTNMVQQTNRSKTAHVVHRIASDMTQKLERTPYPDEVMAEYNRQNKGRKINECEDLVNVEYVYIDNLENSSGDVTDMNNFIDFNSKTMSENDYLSQIDYENNQHSIQILLESLTPKERKAISMFYGLETGVESSLSVIGMTLGVTPERARQLCNHAMNKMTKKCQEYAYAG